MDGLDVITRIIFNIYYGTNLEVFGVAHIDTANGSFCMSTFITQLFWVFNQSVPAWIATLLMINDKNYKNIGLFVALLVPFSPFPVLGIVLMAFAFILFGYDFEKIINWERIKTCFSLTNIFSVLAVIPTGLLLLQNASNKGCVLVRAYQNGKLKETLLFYVLFILLEFSFYLIILTKENCKKILFAFLCFAILPLFYLGGGLDLGNRATIPILTMLYVEILKFTDLEDVKLKLRKRVLGLFLLISFCTNINEFRRSIEYTKYNYEHNVSNFNDQYYTFENFKGKECEVFIKNFIAPVKENNYFFKYLLRGNK